jgi:hypothetical protein
MSGQKQLITTSSNPVPHFCPGSCASSANARQKGPHLKNILSLCWYGDFSIFRLPPGKRFPPANRGSSTRISASLVKSQSIMIIEIRIL